MCWLSDGEALLYHVSAVVLTEHFTGASTCVGVSQLQVVCGWCDGDVT